jgi:hypothetical protein
MLSKSAKRLLTIEVIVGFAPIVGLLLLGVLFVPTEIYAVFDEPLDWQGPAFLIGSVAFGVVGLFCLVFVLHSLFRGGALISRPVLVCAGVTLGLLPIVPYALFADTWVWKAVAGIAPIVVSAHVLFLSRRLLFTSWRDALRSIIVASMLALAIPTALIINPFAPWQSTIRDQRARWERGAPTRYEYTVQLSGWLEPEVLLPKRITVENGEVVSARYVGSSSRHAAGDPAPTEGLWTMDRVFAEVAAAQDKGWRVSARFNERWGFIEKAFADTFEAEAGWRLEVRDFHEIVPGDSDSK